MMKNRKNQELTISEKVLSFALGAGVILAATHGAFFAGNHRDELSPATFTARIVKDLHVHNDFSTHFSHILVDPRSLKNVRSDGEKPTKIDFASGGWDVYRA